MPIITISNGRINPFQGLKGEVLPANQDSVQISLAGTSPYKAVNDRVQRYLPSSTFASLTDFKSQSRRLERRLQQSQYQGLLGGTCLAITLPMMEVRDYGTILKGLMKTVGAAYLEFHPEHEFGNHSGHRLPNKVQVVQETGQVFLLSKLRASPVVALYFPYALQGWSIPAAHELALQLPEGFALAGGIETALALIQYTNILSGSYKMPTLDCAGILLGPDRSVFFRPDDNELVFDRGRLSADENFSSGLLMF